MRFHPGLSYILLAIFSILFALSQKGDAQCIYAVGTPSCDSAVYSGLVNQCSETTLEVHTGHVNFCGNNTIVNNPLYFLFTANDSDITIHIEIGECSGGNAAMQAAILNVTDPCNEWTNGDVLACHPGAVPGQAIFLDFTAVPGQDYFLLIDGSNGAICQYEIYMVSGVQCQGLDGDIVNIFGDQDLCRLASDYAIELSSTIQNFTNYVWTLPWAPDDPVVTEDSVLVFNVPEDAPHGEHVICAYASNGCDTSDSELCLQVTIFPEASITLPEDTSWCMLELMVLYPGPGFSSFIWSTEGTTDSIFISETGLYSVTVFDENDCFDTHTILVHQAGPLAQILGDDYICDTMGGMLALDTVAQNYLWNTGDTTNSIAVNSEGLYCATVTYEACQQIVCKEVMNLDLQSSVIDTTSTNLCLPGAQGLTITATGNRPYYLRYTVGGNEMEIEVWNVGIYFFTFPMIAGQFELYYLGNDQCSVNQLIFEGTLEYSDIYIDTLYISPFDTMDIAEIIVIPGGGQEPYLYQLSTGLEDTTGIFQVEEAGEYCVTISDQLGCQMDTCFNVTGASSVADEKPGLINVYPNPFSSQIWFDGLDYEPVEAFLYDFTGNMLFHKKIILGEPLNMKEYAPGTYLLKIVNKKGKNSIHRIVKVE